MPRTNKDQSPPFQLRYQDGTRCVGPGVVGGGSLMAGTSSSEAPRTMAKPCSVLICVGGDCQSPQGVPRDVRTPVSATICPGHCWNGASPPRRGAGWRLVLRSFVGEGDRNANLRPRRVRRARPGRCNRRTTVQAFRQRRGGKNGGGLDQHSPPNRRRLAVPGNRR